MSTTMGKAATAAIVKLAEGADVAPSARSQHTASCVDGKVFVIGGTDDGKRVFAEMWVYTVESDQWELLDGPGVCSHTATVIGSDVWVVGGWNGSERTCDVWVLHTQSMEWQQISAKGDLPTPRSNHCALGIGSGVWITGRTFGQRKWSDTHSLDTKSLRWTHQGSSSKSRSGHVCWLSSSPGYLCVWGGRDSADVDLVSCQDARKRSSSSSSSNSGSETEEETALLNLIANGSNESRGWTCTKLDKAPPGRSQARCASIGSVVVIYGGLEQGLNSVGALNLYADGSWYSVQEQGQKKGIEAGSSTTRKRVSISKAKSRGKSMLPRRHGHAMCFVPGLGLFVHGGQIGDKKCKDATFAIPLA